MTACKMENKITHIKTMIDYWTSDEVKLPTFQVQQQVKMSSVCAGQMTLSHCT
jgi:hypothetical protein